MELSIWAQDHLVILFIAAVAAIGATGYAALVIAAWLSYGKIHQSPLGDGVDPLLDRFLPRFDVQERHFMHIAAPAPIAFEAACMADLSRSGIIRAIIRLREWILGAAHSPEKEFGRQGLVANAIAQGWGVLTEIPGRVVVMGAVTQPWAKNVVFHAISPEHFADFAEPGYVKIVWTIRVDPKGPAASVHGTETRAIATDPTARAAFRRYWAFFSPGIVLIRLIAIRLVKARAEFLLARIGNERHGHLAS